VWTQHHERHLTGGANKRAHSGDRFHVDVAPRHSIGQHTDVLVFGTDRVDGDPPVLIVTDSGYDIVRLAWLLADLPVHLLGRVRADRSSTPHPHGGRPRRHAHPVKLSDPHTWPQPDTTHIGSSDRYGSVVVHAYGRRHQRLTRRGGWDQHAGRLPIVEGTLVQVQVDRLPGQRAPKPLWL